MPTYDYLCIVCGHLQEVVHGIHGHGPTTCPVCGRPLRKAVAAPAVHFKGSGWAKKDRGAAVSTRAAAKADAPGEKARRGRQAEDEGAPGSSDKAATASTASTASTAADPPAARPSSSAPAEAD